MLPKMMPVVYVQGGFSICLIPKLKLADLLSDHSSHKMYGLYTGIYPFQLSIELDNADTIA